MTDLLLKLIAEAVERVKAMTPQEREAMIQRQRESFVRGELGWPKPKSHSSDDEDYLND